MANNKRAMMAFGIIHIIDGILLPSLWGLSWAFYGIVYIVGAPVWGGILFLIPAGIAGIIASSGENHGAVMVSKIFNSLASIAAIVIIVYSILTIWQNISFGGYGGAVATAVICVLLGILELIISIVAGVYSRNILINQAQSPAVVYGDGIVNPAMQYPGGQVQVQFAGPPPQGQYPGPQPQGQYPGPQPQGQYPGPPPQGQYPGPPPQEVKEKY